MKETTNILLRLPTSYKIKLEKIAAMMTVETGIQYNLTKLIIETLEGEFNLKEINSKTLQ